MYCADNGRYYETPISWYGLARQFGYASWHQSALFFKRNVLAGCFIPHKLLSRRRLVRSRLTGLCSAMRTLRCAATACMGQWVFVTHWRSTPGAVPTSTLTGLFSPGLPITSSRLVQCVMCSTRTSTRDLRHAGVFRRPAVGQPAHSADKFRKLYYDNGSHAGCIVYVNSAMADQESIDSLKKTLTDTRRGGAFKNVLLHAPVAVRTRCRSCPSVRYRRRMSLSA